MKVGDHEAACIGFWFLSPSKPEIELGERDSGMLETMCKKGFPQESRLLFGC